MQPVPAAPAPNKGIAIGLLICALLFVVGAFTRNWYARSEGRMSMGIGLTGAYFCGGDECEGKRFNTDTRGGTGGIVATGYLTFVTLLAAAGLSGAVGGAGLGGKRITGLPVVIVAPIALVLGLAFLGQVADKLHGRGGPTVGYSAFLTILATLAATVLGALQMRSPSVAAAGPLGAPPGYGPGYPSAPGYPPAGYPPAPGYPPAQTAAAAPCPRCQAPTQYVAQYQRAYCGRCQQYV